jgi:hypothetical protein
MKTIRILLVALFILCTGKANAQSPAPEPDTLKEVKQTDPEAKTLPLPRDANYTKDQLRITSKQIPEEIRRVLNSDTQYEGWEKGSFYKNKSGNLYTLEITKADTTRTYRFDASGKPAKE